MNCVLVRRHFDGREKVLSEFCSISEAVEFYTSKIKINPSFDSFYVVDVKTGEASVKTVRQLIFPLVEKFSNKE